MKLLFDQNISFRVVNLIQRKFSEARHTRDFGLEHATDFEIWEFSKSNSYHIVTLDSDFYDLVTLKGHPPKIIWLRVGNTSSMNLARIIADKYDLIRHFLNHDQYSEIGCLEINQ